jgi:hypothetical protein
MSSAAPEHERERRWLDCPSRPKDCRAIDTSADPVLAYPEMPSARNGHPPHVRLVGGKVSAFRRGRELVCDEVVRDFQAGDGVPWGVVPDRAKPDLPPRALIAAIAETVLVEDPNRFGPVDRDRPLDGAELPGLRLAWGGGSRDHDQRETGDENRKPDAHTGYNSRTSTSLLDCEPRVVELLGIWPRSRQASSRLISPAMEPQGPLIPRGVKSVYGPTTAICSTRRGLRLFRLRVVLGSVHRRRGPCWSVDIFGRSGCGSGTCCGADGSGGGMPSCQADGAPPPSSDRTPAAPQTTGESLIEEEE